MGRFSFLFILFCLAVGVACSQRVSFSKPVAVHQSALTDKAMDLTHFKLRYFLAWKKAGDKGSIVLWCPGKHHDTVMQQAVVEIPGSRSSFGPAFSTLKDKAYLLWIDDGGGIKYIVNHSDSSFDVDRVRSLPSNNNLSLSEGLTTAVVGDKIIIGSHGRTKRTLLYAVIDVEADGELGAANWQEVPAAASSNFPTVAAIDDHRARFCWRSKNDKVLYADYIMSSQTWSLPVQPGLMNARTSPTLFSIHEKGQLFFLGQQLQPDNRLYYVSMDGQETASEQTVLPDAFQAGGRVSVCRVDEHNFMLAYPGSDGLIYLSYFSNYNASSWMQDILLPYASDYTLQDIVIPGSHDAGMSVLTAAGGIQQGTINACNTLTQTQPVVKQLQSGLRMFDLRGGIYKGELYARHSSSDCMEEAMGGGYGEKLRPLLEGVRAFLLEHRGEIVLITFSHFCEKELPVAQLADSVAHYIGPALLYRSNGKKLSEIPLRELAGKVIVSFEHEPFAGKPIETCTIADQSTAFVNFRRSYAATNNLGKLLSQQALFFKELQTHGIRENDLIRLDWQLTQSSDEAAMVCNDFQDESLNPAINGALLLTNVLMKHRSITELALKANKQLAGNLEKWISEGVIVKKNKPNILYVDVAGAWITDYCIDLNKTALYKLP